MLVEGLLDCFHFIAIVNIAATHMQLGKKDVEFFEHMTRGCVSGLEHADWFTDWECSLISRMATPASYNHTKGNEGFLSPTVFSPAFALVCWYLWIS